MPPVSCFLFAALNLFRIVRLRRLNRTCFGFRILLLCSVRPPLPDNTPRNHLRGRCAEEYPRVTGSAATFVIPGPSAAATRRFAVHGPLLEIDCDVPAVSAEVGRVLAPFEVSDWPEGFGSLAGCVRAYDRAQVVRHVSPAARPVPAQRSLDLAELYEEGERFWLVDERWGMVEVNFLKGSWRSWVLPQPRMDPVRVAEMAVLWPAAQLLRPRGLY